MKAVPLQVARYITAVATLAALSVSALFPVGYYVIADKRLEAEVQAEARIQAGLVSAVVGRNPGVWRFATERLHEAVTWARHDTRLTRVLDRHETTLVEVGPSLKPPVVSARAPFFDSGEPVGEVEVTASIRAVLHQTLWVFLGSAALAGLIFVPLRRLPLRAVADAYAILARNEHKYRSVVNGLREGVVLADDQLRVIAMNVAAERILGRPTASLMGSRLQTSLLHVVDERGEPLPPTHWPLARCLETGQPQEGCVLGLVEPSRAPVWLAVNAQVIRGIGGRGEGAGTAVVASFEDITDRVKAEQRVRALAHKDPLTGLSNRSMLQEELARAIAMASRRGWRLGVLFIDLDHFKSVNDTLGHAAGDSVLIEVAHRLRSILRPDDVVSRLAGDEFVVVVHDVATPPDFSSVAGRIMGALSEPVRVFDRELLITPSIGISVYPEDGEDIDSLLSHADTAMYSSKEAGRGTVRFFSREMNGVVSRRHEVSNAVRRALREEEFLLYYQPQVDAASGRLWGVEALIRWLDPDRGVVPPAEFVPVVEGTRLIIEIGEWVLAEALRQQREWRRTGVLDCPIAVNVSALHFRQDDFLTQLRRLAGEGHSGGSGIGLELTEGLMVADPEVAAQKMLAAREMGFGLSLDDFGTGYSSLSYLTRFPFDTLKIDRSFVQRLPGDTRSLAIIEAIVRLAHAVDIRVVAEGVETLAQAEVLAGKGCDVFQGYLYGAPMPAHEFEKRLTAAGGPDRRGIILRAG